MYNTCIIHNTGWISTYYRTLVVTPEEPYLMDMTTDVYETVSGQLRGTTLPVVLTCITQALCALLAVWSRVGAVSAWFGRITT